MSYSPPRTTKRATRQAHVQRKVWPAVLRRARRVCEGCQRPVRIEWAHLFGRPGSGFCLGPVANSKELTMALCRDCHNGVDRGTNVAKAWALRMTAIVRLSSAIGWEWSYEDYPGPPDIRQTVRHMEETGWHYDEERCELVHTDP